MDQGTTWNSSLRISRHQAEISTQDFLNTEQEYSHSNMPMSISRYQTHDLHDCHHEVHTELCFEPVQSTSSFSKTNFNIIQFIYLLISHDQESNKMDQCGLASTNVEWLPVLQNSHQVSWKYVSWYQDADKSLARPTYCCILFYGENISSDASLVIYINSTNIPPIMIINGIYEHQNLLSLQLVSFLVRLRTYQHPCRILLWGDIPAQAWVH